MRDTTAIEILDEMRAQVDAGAFIGPRVPTLRSVLGLAHALIGNDAQAPSRARAIIGAVAALSGRVELLAYADLAPNDPRRDTAIHPGLVLGGEELAP